MRTKDSTQWTCVLCDLPAEKIESKPIVFEQKEELELESASDMDSFDEDALLARFAAGDSPEQIQRRC